MNLLIFTGTVVRTPRYNDGGKSPVLGFTLLSVRKWKDREFKNYCDCSIFGEKATELKGQFDVGDYVQVQGEAGARHYESGGDHKASLTCNALSVEVVAQTQSERQAPKREVVTASPPVSGDGEKDADDDIPF